MEFGLVLIEKESGYGLTRSEINDLFDMIDGNEVLPIEILSNEYECSAMGFISIESAYEVDYDYERSGLNEFIANILDDMNNENEYHTYEFRGIKIWLSR